MTEITRRLAKALEPFAGFDPPRDLYEGDLHNRRVVISERALDNATAALTAYRSQPSESGVDGGLREFVLEQILELGASEGVVFERILLRDTVDAIMSRAIVPHPRSEEARKLFVRVERIIKDMGRPGEFSTNEDELNDLRALSTVLEAYEQLHARSVAVAAWINNALDDPNVCDAMKADITAWLEVLHP